MTDTLLPCQCSLRLQYVNSKREISERTVDVLRFANRADGHLVGFCHHRNRVRTFAYSGIAEATDTATGEIIPADKVFLHLLKIHQQAPERALDHFLRSHKPLINILIYIGYCDGRFVAPERAAIIEWLLAETALSPDFADYAVSVVKSWPQPDFAEFLFSVAAIIRHMPDTIPALMHKAQAVADADGKLHTNESRAIALLQTLFQAAQNP